MPVERTYPISRATCRATRTRTPTRRSSLRASGMTSLAFIGTLTTTIGTFRSVIDRYHDDKSFNCNLLRNVHDRSLSGMLPPVFVAPIQVDLTDQGRRFSTDHAIVRSPSSSASQSLSSLKTIRSITFKPRYFHRSLEHSQIGRTNIFLSRAQTTLRSSVRSAKKKNHTDWGEFK